jgi:KipI family sensor histidine kinase inhibitor
MPRILPCGDNAILISFATDSDPAERVAALDARLAQVPVAGVAELVPGIDSLLAVLDGQVGVTAVSIALERTVQALADGAITAPPAPARALIDVPVRFGGDEGPDLAELAARTGFEPAGLVAALTAAPLRVALIGHLPGLPYLAGLPDSLDVPRRPTPRTAVPEGSVGVAAGMACIYPVRAPGGWHIVGRTSAQLCDPERDPPFLVAAGDSVQLIDVGQEHDDVGC